MSDVSMLLGGPQGGGIESAGQIALKSILLKGYNVIGTREYHSNIMGAHSYYHLRFTDGPARALRLPVDVVVALDAESALTHIWDVSKGSFFIYDADSKDQSISRIPSMEHSLKKRVREALASIGEEPTVEGAVKYVEKERGATPLGLPIKSLLKKVADEVGSPVSSVAKTVNIIGLSAALYSIGIEQDYIAKGIELQFGKKQKVLAPNIVASRISIEYIEATLGKRAPLPDGPHKGRERMIVSGNEIVAIGKLVGGLTFETFYPITPASDEAFYVEENMNVRLDGAGEISAAVLQTEDEIAAINMALGAALAGARAATSTSGPGYSLMNEAISMAVQAEIPVVISLWMRAGPSTGIATRQGQQDLLHAIFSGHGDTPKIVVASGDHIEAFYDTVKSLNWAEEFQTPVIHLLDKYLASTMVSIDRWDVDLGNVRISRGSKIYSPPSDYKRYEITESGISPMAPLGITPMMVSSLEHDEHGYASEDPVDREEMMEKRLRKFATIAKRIPETEKLVLHGDPDAKITLVSFGSTKQAILSAMEELERKGIKINFLQFRILSPFPAESAAKVLSRSERIIAVEMNALGQLSFLIRAHTGIKVNHFIRKINSRPLYDVDVVYGVSQALETGAEIVRVMSGA